MSSTASTLKAKVGMAHRWTAIFLCIFIVVHLSNQLVALAGAEAHIAYMDVLRQVYRQPLVEVILLAAILVQVLLGIYLFIKALKYSPSFFGKLQYFSGAYLGLFLVIHVSAILYGRAGLGLDTNFYYAVAGYQFTLARLFFAPYYFLAIIAFFTHIGCAVYWVKYKTNASVAFKQAVTIIIAGMVISVLVSSALLGISIRYEVPANYLVNYI
ncbi:MAG: hypothetical protein L3J21_12380 [Devosiaceae bacterium]|nr:hypothetical protein [Devosiaceae bacterium]